MTRGSYPGGGDLPAIPRDGRRRRNPERHVSRTDKTQPFRVRLWDGTLTRVAVHDHSDGACDLPATYLDDLAQYATDGGRFSRGSCYWAMRFTGTMACCCDMCHDAAGLRAERRADRHRTRRELADLVKEANTGSHDLD